MVGCLGQSRPAQDADVVARTVVATALAALAVIHAVDLPNTLGPTALVGVAYFGIIAVAMLAGAVMIIRSHWLAWAVAGGLAVTAMGGYVLTRSLPGGFLDDHGDGPAAASSPVRAATGSCPPAGAWQQHRWTSQESYPR